MSKYIKLEDAIHNINLEVTGRKEYTGDMKANLFFALDDLPTVDIVFCEECNHAPYCEQRLAKEMFGNEVAEWREVDFCQHGERIGNE